MWRLGALWRRIRFFIARDRYAAELEEEMRLHIALREARLREQGASATDAHFGARRRFGNAANIQQRSRDMWGLDSLDQLRADVRFAVRRLRRRPGFAFAAIVVVALGIGASTAVFSAIDAALIRPLPFTHPDELVTLTDVTIPFDMGGIGAPRRPGPHPIEFGDAADMRELFTQVAAYANGGLNLEEAGNPRRLRVGVVTPSFFSTLGAEVRIGRGFTADEGRPDGAHVVVISDNFWHNALGGAPGVVGQSLNLSGKRYAIVGIAQPNFTFPNESDLWLPLSVPVTMETFAPFRGFLQAQVVARLAPGVSVPTADARLRARWTVQLLSPDGKPRPNFTRVAAHIREKGALVPLRRQLVGDRRAALLLLVGATGLLLLIACANVASLLLSDGASRRREIALREVLGANRIRIVRQLLAESVVLALVGAATGLLLAPLGLRVLRAMMPEELVGIAPAQLDLRVLAFAAALALVTGLVFGLWPAFSSARGNAAETIKAGGTGAVGADMGGARRAIIMLELALTVMLLVGAGLMLRSLQTVMSRVTGMDPSHVGVLQLSIAVDRGTSNTRAMVRAMLERLSIEPGVAAAAAVNDLPLGKEGGMALSINVDGAPQAKSPAQMSFARYLITSRDYFNAMGIRVLRGRTFLPSDDSVAPRVAVINEAMARRYWPNQEALGRAFHLGTNAVTVVGVVADLHQDKLEDSVAAQMYLPMDQEPQHNLALIARSSLPPGVLLARMTDAVHAVDRTQAVYGVRMMDDIVVASELPRRTNTLLIAIFGGVALALSAFGIYAVVSFSVTRRLREFGIRAALGATHGDIASLVGREMGSIVVVGIALGLGGAWMLSRVMSSLLFGVTTHDAVTFATVPVVLLVAAMVAALLPATRAMRVDPAMVMRAE